MKKIIDPQISRVKFRNGGPFVTIEIYDEIDMDLAEYFVEQVNLGQNTGQEVIPVTINSPGGDVYALSVMLESIEGSTVPIATIVTGFAASAAVGLFAAGANNMRFIAPGGRLMIHNASMCGFGHMSLREVEIEGGELKLLNGQMFRQMGQHCKEDPDYYIKIIKAHGDHDLYMAAKGGAKATRACRPWRLVGQVKSIPTQSIAQVMEHQARKQAITSRHSHKSMLQSRIQALMDTADKHKLTCFFTGPPESWI